MINKAMPRGSRIQDAPNAEQKYSDELATIIDNLVKDDSSSGTVTEELIDTTSAN